MGISFVVTAGLVEVVSLWSGSPVKGVVGLLGMSTHGEVEEEERREAEVFVELTKQESDCAEE